MREPVRIPVLGSDGDASPWEFAGPQTSNAFTLTATDTEGVRWSGTGSDWFEALRGVRIALDAIGRRPPQGEYVYLLEPGRTPRETVWIFAPANPVDVVGVAEQDAFYERWLSSPPRRGAFEPLTGLLREWKHRVRNR